MRAPAPAPASRNAAARRAALEAVLGDPREAGNPLGDAAVLAADHRGELPLGGEPLLASFALHEDFVPREYGGRLAGLDEAAVLLRAVFRRDAALGRGYGSASLAAALHVWCYGTEEQRKRTARALLAGERIAGGRAAEDGLTATPGGRLAALRLTGRTAALVNAPRATGFVVVPRHTGPDGESVLLLHRDDLPARAVVQLSPYDVTVPRRIPAGELVLQDWPVPAGAVIGEAGDGQWVTRRVSQVRHALVPSMAVGCADSALRTVLTAVLAERGGVRGLRSRVTRRLVAGAFADLLAADCLSLVALRSLHLMPERSSIWSAAARYLGLRLLQEGVGDLLTVLGTDSMRGDDGLGVFHKQVRDLAALPPGPAGSAAALATLLPQLPTLARRSWTAQGRAAGEELFLPDGPVPPLNSARLKLAAADDGVTVLLAQARDGVPGLPAQDWPAALPDELAVLREQCRRLPELDPAALANPRAFALAERYALLAAAAACLGVFQTARHTGRGGFLAEPAWLLTALARIGVRLGLPVTAPGAAAGEDVLLAEAVRRCRAARTFDLYDTALGAPARPREKG
ncbi:acyl-CoA dehydrogenase family protein [Streptomyces sp. NPDC052682]|uniref:acyl-CoA dehydrogenase family protein n=1 Tax=Streptomyces sp. NPDC052682 TaxID=3154954 RepID=UPI00343D723D